MNKIKNTLQQIEQTLLKFGYPVFYGRSFIGSNDKFNYFVFNRQQITRSGKTNNDFTLYYQVHIIMEDYIPEGFELDVIDAIQENTKLKLTNNSMSYQYTTKGSTDIVVELLTITFALPLKRCNLKGE